MREALDVLQQGAACEHSKRAQSPFASIAGELDKVLRVICLHLGIRTGENCNIVATFALINDGLPDRFKQLLRGDCVVDDGERLRVHCNVSSGSGKRSPGG
jgi:hypothetical protein